MGCNAGQIQGSRPRSQVGDQDHHRPTVGVRLVDLVLNPPILFFFLGVFATLVRSDLEIPKPAARVISLYLLMALGLYGGYKLEQSGLNTQALTVMGVAVMASFLMPLVTYLVLRVRLAPADAAGIAATFGSISAVTFITAVAFMENAGVPYSGFMVAAMVLMESPAIISGVLLARLAMHGASESIPEFDDRSLSSPSWGQLLHESALNGAVLLLVGSMIIGFVAGEEGWQSVKPLMYDPFRGVLCLFLLDMGLTAARRFGDLRAAGGFLVFFGVIGAIVQGLIGVAAARLLGLGHGDALLLAVMFGSASYIAVPAALRLVLPEANPSLYIPVSLAITFPFNITIGIPMYYFLIAALWPATADTTTTTIIPA
ncbi:MAG: sodium-dependent bicarbonate transport family permease [Planctomycetota bacterium]